MRLVAGILKEVFGLFVDDGSLAIAILIWVAVFAFLQVQFGFGGQWSGLLLFGGLAALLIENVLRRARRS